MRCKNCGTNNDDNRYICEICGSPLYDDNEINDTPDNDLTKTFKAADDEYTAAAPQNNKNNTPNDNKESQKKSIIVIAILVVVLVAIITSVIVVAKGKADNNTPSTSQLTTVSTTEKTTKPKEDKTTESTTESTTETTTELTTTAPAVWFINVSCGGGGTVTGSGEYKNGEKVTIAATADNGYIFDGWYSNGIMVSSSSKYTFTANENISFSAVFTPVTTQAEEEPEQAENISGGVD